MPHIIADRVQETSTTTGTGAFTLGGAVTGFRTFGSVMANADTVYYTATDQAQSANWEVGVGTWNTGGTLSRTTILASSNAGAAVNFTSGALYIFGTYPASKTVYDDPADRVGLGVVTPTAVLHLKAGAASASNAPLKFTSGTNLSAVEAGAVEYDGTKFFATNGETGSGRSVLDNAHYYYVNATSGAIGAAIADLFASAAFTMQAGGIYMIEWHPYLTKTTAGTLTYTVTTTQTPVSVTAGYMNAQSALTAGNAAVAGATTTTALPATASIATGAVLYLPVRAFITANATTGGTVRLQITNGAGTVTLGRGSHIIVRRMPTGTTTGAFA